MHRPCVKKNSERVGPKEGEKVGSGWNRENLGVYGRPNEAGGLGFTQAIGSSS